MRITFSGLRADVPDGWTDASTLVFMMPASTLTAPLAKQRKADRSPANVAISWGAAPKGASAAHAAVLLEGRLDEMQRALPGFTRRAHGERDGVAWAEVSFDAEAPLVQLVMSRIVGPTAISVTGSALLAAYSDALRDRFLDVARSIAPTAPAK